MQSALDYLLAINSQARYLVASSEGDIDGKIHDEIEFTYYFKLTDLSQLDKAIKVEEHEQWTIPIKSGKSGKARLRLIDNRRYTMATKMYRTGKIGLEEVESDISADMFSHLRELSINGYKKTRYVFPTPTPGLVWEVDVFRSQSGGKHPWVKVDLEVKDIHQPIPKFPLDHEAMINGDDENMTRSDKNFINDLWNNEWSKLDGASAIAEGANGTTDLGKKESSVLE